MKWRQIVYVGYAKSIATFWFHLKSEHLVSLLLLLLSLLSHSDPIHAGVCNIALHYSLKSQLMQYTYLRSCY